jgi:NADH-ubiquinone oxidoreductase chain 2
MLTITLIALVLAIPLSSATISATLLTRIVSISLLFAATLSYNCFPSSLAAEGVNNTTLDSGLIHATTVTQSMEVFLLVSGALILLPWSSSLVSRGPIVPEYSMIILFTTMGATFLLASADLVSMYLSIELQSFGVYILAALYRDSESATAAGLKYFLLGALSSALILLGSALVYAYTGLTNLDSIYELMSVPSEDVYGLVPAQAITLGFIIISVGLLFKVASAPFHYWAPDVYDGTPTIVTTWLTVMPKISIFVFLLELYRGTAHSSISMDGLLGSLYNTSSYNYVTNTSLTTNMLLICAFLSLIIGTVVGLGQYRIKRLLAYSTISHVGFLLLALAIGSTSISYGEESVEAFLFYIVQYTLTNINAFFVLLAFGYIMYSTVNTNTSGQDVQFTSELQGQFRSNPVLGLSFAVCLFSMAGVPPLIGFFAKYTVLYSAIHSGYLFLSIVAILASVVSAVYYLRIIRVIHFSPGAGGLSTDDVGSVLTSVHSYTIASLTLFIMLFAVNPTLILNSTSIMALSLFVT